MSANSLQKFRHVFELDSSLTTTYNGMYATDGGGADLH